MSLLEVLTELRKSFTLVAMVYYSERTQAQISKRTRLVGQNQWEAFQVSCRSGVT